MSRVLILVVCAAVLGVSMAGAAPMPGARSWAEINSNRVEQLLSGNGISNRAEQAEITAAWDEDTFVDVALKHRSFGLIAFAVSRDKLSAANMERVKAAILAEKIPPEVTPEIVVAFPVPERGAFEAGAATVMARRYAEQPEYGRLFLKYNVLQGVHLVSTNASLDDLMGLLLAPEPLDLSVVASAKLVIKERAIVLARTKLRAEGKSFVLKDGVNPLVAKVQPVVDGLNAPACEGLEAALRALGADVRDVERGDLKKLGDTWRAQVMRGDVLGNDAARLLGKIAVVLGADGYNRFVDEYNNGKVGGK